MWGGFKLCKVGLSSNLQPGLIHSFIHSFICNGMAKYLLQEFQEVITSPTYLDIKYGRESPGLGIQDNTV